MKAVDLLVQDALPEDVQDDYSYDKKSMNVLSSRIAAKYPERYQDIIQRISDIGRNAAYTSGQTLTLNDMRPVIDKEKIFDQMDDELKKARIFEKTKDDIKNKELEIYAKYADLIEKETMQNALRQGNNLGNTVVSGARGKPDQLKGMISTPALYTDYQDKPIPLFVRRSFGEGLRPHEYLASTFGARKGIISTKNATAQAGDLGKLLLQTASPQMVTEHDCGVKNGIDLSIQDDSLQGRVLAEDTAGLPAGTVLDRDSMQVLRKKGVNNVVARSAMTCEAKEGVCKKCLGADIKGDFKSIGDAAGATSANAIGEPIAQEGLDVKHSGGVASKKKDFSGFETISQIVQSPSNYPNEATLATANGTVEKIEKAPQGGTNVYINGKRHYVLPDFEIYANEGDEIEKGQQISEGIVDVSKVVDMRGLGEGRRVYSENLKKALDDSGIGTNKKHTELIAKAAINHVNIEDGDDSSEYLPGDVVTYDNYKQEYEPDPESEEVRTEHAAGKYLQKPVLHYSIGTQLTPDMTKRIRKNKKDRVLVSNNPPNFKSKMIRLRNVSQHSDSWVQRMGTSYLKQNIEDSAIRGLETDTKKSINFNDTLARGKHFGKDIEQTGRF